MESQPSERPTCSVCQGLSNRPVWGSGPKKVRMVLIGEAPGSEEDLKGKPFVGGAGRVLNKALMMAGIPRSEVYITNIVKCRPPGNRTPTQGEIARCLPLLKAELASIDFNVIVALGDTAFSTLCNRESSILTYRGSPTFTEVIKHEDGSPAKLLPTLHPAFIMRQWIFMDVLAVDLKKAWKWADSKEYSPPQKNYLLPTSEGAKEYIDGLLKSGCACDIETTSLYPWSGKILGIAFSNAPGTGIFFKLPTYQAEVQAILEHPCRKVFQFGTFDTFYLRWNDYRVEGYDFDTKFAQHLLCPELPASLAFLSSIYTMYPYYKTWKGKEIRKDPGTVPQTILEEYCTQDADATWQCHLALAGELEEEGLTQLMQEHIMPLTQVVVDLRLRGFRLNVAKLGELKAQLLPQIEQFQALFQSLKVDPNSPKQLGSFVTAMYPHLSFPKTRTGQLQVDERALSRALKKDPEAKLLQALLDYRELNKLYSTYLKGLDERRVGDRLHTELVIGGTETGRLSSRDPNLQNVPKDMRKMFIPEEGEILLEADYGQMELHTAAALAQDRHLISDLSQGVDIPTKIGKAMGYSDERCKKDRLLLKTILYGSLYGRTAKSIALDFGITLAEAQRIINSIVSYYPMLAAQLASQREHAEKHGFIRTPFGRKMYMLQTGYNPKAYNYPIQSSAADVMMGSLILLNRSLPGMLKHTVHDSVVLSVPIKHLDEVAQQVHGILTRPIAQLGGHSFPAKMEVGYSWGDLEPWKSTPPA